MTCISWTSNPSEARQQSSPESSRPMTPKTQHVEGDLTQVPYDVPLVGVVTLSPLEQEYDAI